MSDEKENGMPGSVRCPPGCRILFDHDHRVPDTQAALAKFRRAGRETAKIVELMVALREAREFIMRSLGHDVDVPGFDPTTHVTVKRIDAALRLANDPVAHADDCASLRYVAETNGVTAIECDCLSPKGTP